MLPEVSPFKRYAFQADRDYMITFKFHHKEDIIALVLNIETPFVLKPGVDYTLIHKFGTPYLRMHYSGEVMIDSHLLIMRSCDIEQNLPIPVSKTEPRPNLEIQLDRIVMMIQEMKAPMDTVVVFPSFDQAGKTLPPAEDRSNRSLAFDSSPTSEILTPAIPTSPVQPTEYQQGGLETTDDGEYKTYHKIFISGGEELTRIQQALQNLTGVTVLPIYEPFPVIP